MIKIVDYGLGNLKAFANIYKRLNIPFELAQNSADLKGASKIILPGVGAFDHAMEKLNASGMREDLDRLVLQDKVPVLGICVGMQMLGNSSDEGDLEGLKWIDGEVKKFDIRLISQKPQLPHMGWNDVTPVRSNPLFKDMGGKAIFYFLHSYYFSCNKAEDGIANSNYGFEYTCAVNDENIFGVQFHPEKSHQCGIQLLKNFATI